ncbi:MAG: hypothetical protein IIX73_03760 [Clostridia bacterium]|nr:hypothetical protein [Clostridia bacterium]MBQ2273908.1 hypothetical protein [Clostridia bacterium]MBQ5900587.1 hypothetical protein [Clostridia bacterium]MEE1278935.1 YerC/YecD family TrpR-related protein [Acutalibacteraceae bacterium]
MKQLKNAYMDDFFKAVLTLENVDECYKFFEDVCTVKELEAIAQRFTVAKMLTDKKVYSEIVDAVGASTATISRVNRSLSYGANGYELVFSRMEK